MNYLMFDKSIMSTRSTSCICIISFVRFGIILALLFSTSIDARSQYLKRSIFNISEVSVDISTQTAHYKPMFGIGDDSSIIVRAVNRYGNLTIDPLGSSNVVKYDDEELVLFVLGGTGNLQYGEENVPVSKNDFLYIPVGTKFGISNPRERPLSVIVMGFKIFPGTVIKPTTKLMIANADDVPLQVLPSHGPTTQFQLLMGTTESTRDKLAAFQLQVCSLWTLL